MIKVSLDGFVTNARDLLSAMNAYYSYMELMGKDRPDVSWCQRRMSYYDGLADGHSRSLRLACEAADIDYEALISMVKAIRRWEKRNNDQVSFRLPANQNRVWRTLAELPLERKYWPSTFRRDRSLTI